MVLTRQIRMSGYQDFNELLIQTTGPKLGMISHPKRHQDHNDYTDGGTFESEFAVVALA